MVKFLSTTTFFSLITVFLQAQSFTGMGKSFVDKKFNEYKVQQFLMSDVYDVSSTTPVYFEFEHIFRDYEKDDGDFLLMLSSYRMNDSTGLVLTSFAGGHQMGIELTGYYTLHLTDKQFDSLNDAINTTLSHLVTLRNSGYESDDSHFLLTVNKNIKVDAIYDQIGVYYITIWINGTNRHSFPMSRWKSAYASHKKFISFKK